MSRTQTCDAIVLRAYDVGDADRFCVLFTRERGRLAARVRAARKIGSRLGGSLLPHRRLQVSLHEGKTGYLVTGALVTPTQPPTGHSLDTFLRREQISELLLKLLHDEEPLPDIFDLTLQSLNETLPDVEKYTVSLLQQLGLLPERESTMSAVEWKKMCEAVLAEHASGAWRAAAVAQTVLRQ